MPDTLESPRLLLRPFTEEDLNALALLMGDPEVMRFSLTGPLSRADSEGVLGRFMASYAENGFGVFAVFEKALGRVIGYCGFLHQTIRGQLEVEISFRLIPEFWGQGIATEAAALVRDYGLNALGKKRLVSMIDPRNTASIRVAKKIGMVFREEYFFRKDLFVHIYEIQKEPPLT